MSPVLVVEDETHLREFYAEEIKDAGYEVQPVSTGKEAIDRIKRERPKVVVLDIMLPDISGLKVLEEIKSIDKTIPVILNSAYAVYKSDFLSWMADDYVVKSSDISELIGKVRRYAGIAKPAVSLVTT